MRWVLKQNQIFDDGMMGWDAPEKYLNSGEVLSKDKDTCFGGVSFGNGCGF